MRNPWSNTYWSFSIIFNFMRIVPEAFCMVRLQEAALHMHTHNTRTYRNILAAQYSMAIMCIRVADILYSAADHCSSYLCLRYSEIISIARAPSLLPTLRQTTSKQNHYLNVHLRTLITTSRSAMIHFNWCIFSKSLFFQRFKCLCAFSFVCRRVQNFCLVLVPM